MLGLGIESTAHTFGASVVNSTKILSDVKDVYKPPEGSGIHPREASRHHTEKAAEVIKQALEKAAVKPKELNFVAYSMGPGLGPCLRVGAVVARTLSSYMKIPLIPVNHAVGHIEIGAMLTGALDPVVLLVSGGHTVICAFEADRWRIFGETLDLSIGQLLDQFGREAGFASPCGARIEQHALSSSNLLPLPYSVKGQDVSYSGMLTAAKKMLHSGKPFDDICYSLQETGFAMLVEVAERAIAFTEKKQLLVVGGVAANRRLSEMLKEVSTRHGAGLYVVPLTYSGDCGAQIAWTGLLAYRAGEEIQVERSVVRQSWRLDQVDVPWRSS
ncbi:MAG: N(6)-L-threonylcarbamoyladenine synthase Kae1 [Thaumarchaeota archaeon]|nr:N(6)-L-threonylcarbamoyladenine synthase Kae1 [Nitrososphaerota archaeon]